VYAKNYKEMEKQNMQKVDEERLRQNNNLVL